MTALILNLLALGLGEPPPPSPIVLPASAVEEVDLYFRGVEGALARILAGDEAALDAAGAFGEDRERFGGQLRVFGTKGRELGAVAGPRIAGFEVEATLWYGIIPMRRIQLYFWRLGGELRLLRWSDLGEADLHFFDQSGSPRWQTGPATAMGSLARELLEAGARGQCRDLPLARDEDLPAALPKEPQQQAKTVVHLERFRRQVAQQCAGLQQALFDHVTWRLGEAGGLVKSLAGDPFTFRVSLVPDRHGRLALDLLTAPVGPKAP